MNLGFVRKVKAVLRGELEDDISGLLNDLYSGVSGGQQSATLRRERHFLFNHGNAAVVYAGDVDAHRFCCLLVVGLPEADREQIGKASLL